MRTLIASALAFLLAAAFLAAPQAARAQTKANDFIARAVAAHAYGIELGKLAGERSQTNAVRATAAKAADDYRALNDRLVPIAVGLTNKPAPAPKLEAKQKDTLDRLKNARGGEFDKRFVSAQVDAHKEAIDLYKTYANRGDTEALKQYARGALPTLEDDLNRARALAKD